MTVHASQYHSYLLPVLCKSICASQEKDDTRHQQSVVSRGVSGACEQAL